MGVKRYSLNGDDVSQFSKLAEKREMMRLEEVDSQQGKINKNLSVPEYVRLRLIPVHETFETRLPVCIFGRNVCQFSIFHS